MSKTLQFQNCMGDGVIHRPCNLDRPGGTIKRCVGAILLQITDRRDLDVLYPGQMIAIHLEYFRADCRAKPALAAAFSMYRHSHQ